MQAKIKIGLIGAGKFGGYHAAKCAAHNELDFRGVFDINPDNARALAERYNVRVFQSAEALALDCEAVIVAPPAIHHGHYARQVLEAGCHALIEKPLAVTVKDAEAIEKISKADNLIVQVGHQERFVGRAIGLDRIPEKPVLIRAKRLNVFSQRGTDTSVTLDLMSHDIDLVQWIMSEQPRGVSANGRREKSGSYDHVFAELQFDNCTAFLEASRVAKQGERTLCLDYPSGTLRIDLNAKTLQHNTPFDINADFGSSAEAKDSLAAGMDEFVRAIKEKRTPFISASDGLKAVKTALKVDEKS